MENKISFQELLQKIRQLPKDGGIGYIGEIPIKVSFNVWIETDAEGKVCHFTPHLNFYQSEHDDDEHTRVYAQLEIDQFEVSTPQDAAEFLETFVRQAGIDTAAPSLEEDEAYG